MEKIAVVITAYNEEQRIKNVLRSLRKFEIIIVLDKSSTDKTREVARQYGATVIQVPYSDHDPEEYYDLEIEEMKRQGATWSLNFVCSDICHKDLYEEMNKAVNGYAKEYDCINVPFIQYSMGLEGKHTFYNGHHTKPLLTRIDAMQYTSVIHNFNIKLDAKVIDLKCADSKIGIYHLTHENIDIIMERHNRYAKTVANNRHNSGRTKERELRSCTVAAIRHQLDYIKKGVFRRKWDGLAQFFMLMMYYSMIYLYTYFDNDKQKEIQKRYSDIREELIGNDDEQNKELVKKKQTD